ncbi:hypothetical protein Peur_009651 [Populus x canadensis]
MNDNFSPSHPDVPQDWSCYRFYPLGGKIKDVSFSIYCNDKGAYYVETRVLDFNLDEFRGQPDLLAVCQFLPCELIVKESTAAVYVTSVQENVFECGGNGFGMCTCHKFLDGAALSSFMKAWTATA